uniref:Proline-rich Gla (G-carboxyglutamic acid) polypeptide 2 n=2 Tax=Mus musculus TaxID=10090 RepID=A0A1B0GRN8_MOUSE
MRGRPSLLLVYMGLATCLDTSPHREQNQGALLGKLYVQWQGRAWTGGCCRPGGGTDLWDPPHCLGRLGSLLVSALSTAPPQRPGVLSARDRAHHPLESSDASISTLAPRPSHL